MKILFSVVLLYAHVFCNAQRYQRMTPNRDNYVSIGCAKSYTGVRLGLQLSPHFFLEGQALTDGGAIWKADEYNDWRCLTILKGWQLPCVNSKLKFGGGLLQTEEPPFTIEKMRLRTVAQLAYSTPINQNCFITWSITYPFNKILNIYPVTLYSLEYRLRGYSKVNGLF